MRTEYKQGLTVHSLQYCRHRHRPGLNTSRVWRVTGLNEPKRHVLKTVVWCRVLGTGLEVRKDCQI